MVVTIEFSGGGIMVAVLLPRVVEKLEWSSHPSKQSGDPMMSSGPRKKSSGNNSEEDEEQMGVGVAYTRTGKDKAKNLKGSSGSYHHQRLGSNYGINTDDTGSGEIELSFVPLNTVRSMDPIPSPSVRSLHTPSPNPSPSPLPTHPEGNEPSDESPPGPAPASGTKKLRPSHGKGSHSDDDNESGTSDEEMNLPPVDATPKKNAIHLEAPRATRIRDPDDDMFVT